MTTSAQPTRVPLPLHEVLSRLAMSPAVDVQAVLEHVAVHPFVLQDFRPLTETLEWELSSLHWAEVGVLPFADNDVPFVINNTGRLSENAAAVFFAHCCEHDDGSAITAVELGAGTGLFARLFLDAFRSVCEKEGRDFYHRLRYVATDGSRRTIEQWEERQIFAAHTERVLTGTCDALEPGSFRALDGPSSGLSGVRAVFCNYVLDVLPCTIVRAAPGTAAGCEELQVRTHLVNDLELIGQYTRLTPEEIRLLAHSADARDRGRLIPLVTLLDYEVAFRPVALPPFADLALAAAPEATRVVVNFGALQCLSAWAAALESRGWILVNDYGAASTADVSEHATAQRFGVTSAVGINFPLVERYLSDRGLTVLQPDGDRERAIHTRLIAAELLPRTAETLRSRFSLEADRFVQEPLAQARSHAAAGRLNEALEEYKLGLARNPRDWYVLGEVADFVGQRLHDWSAAAELARAAVELNPWYSGWLWNVLGDCLYGLGRVDASHEAYLQAHRIDPLDARTNLELAFTWAQRGQYDEALAAIARGLAHDRQASFRERFLEKQQHVLATISGRRLGEHERLAKRLSYFRSAPGT